MDVSSSRCYPSSPAAAGRRSRRGGRRRGFDSLARHLAVLRRRAGLTPTRLVNLALYQAGWFACVAGAAAGRPWLGATVGLVLVGAHLGLARDRAAELRLAVAAGTIGLVLDSLQVAAGALSFPHGSLAAAMAPPWVVVLWVQFATLLHFGLSWLSRRYLLAAASGAVGGPLAFVGGERLGAVDFADPLAFSLGTLAVAWAAAMPALVWLADRWRPRRGGGYRFGASGWRPPERSRRRPPLAAGAEGG